jgi:hypothetical protein
LSKLDIIVIASATGGFICMAILVLYRTQRRASAANFPYEVL